MNEVISKLTHLVEGIPQRFTTFSEIELSTRPSPNKWSKKEILGHLCDSAINNLSRFIKVQTDEQPFLVTKYDQDQWVRLQNYHHTKAEDILQLWIHLNQSIIRVISMIPEEKYSYVCKLHNGDTITLQWLINDYLKHMEHHLRQIFPDCSRVEN